MSALTYRSGHGARALLSSSAPRVAQPAPRAPNYRRLSQLATAKKIGLQSQAVNREHAIRLRSPFTPESLYFLSAHSRQLHVTPLRSQGDKKDSTSKAEDTAKEQEQKDKKEEDKEENGDKKEESKSEGEGEGEQEGKQKSKKEDAPPPPPHGDKTPWEVFRETFKTEMESSKEWNESTKALSSSAHDFAESERVRKAREAYEKTSGAVSSTTSRVMRGTGRGLAKGATWTWDTSVMKGMRSAANATGQTLDKATKPIRDTEAYKNVKNVIDDGSSSRYGGWVEKEERRKRREQMEKEGKRPEVMQEDPE